MSKVNPFLREDVSWITKGGEASNCGALAPSPCAPSRQARAPVAPQDFSTLNSSPTRFLCYTEFVAKARTLQNVTLTLDPQLVRRARHLAVERGVSLSRLLAEELEQLVERDERFERASRRLFLRMRKGFDLGLNDSRVGWSRSDLHER